MNIRIIPATESDIPELLNEIRALAEYQKLDHLATATEEQLRKTLFGPHPFAEVLLAFYGCDCAGYALFYSTFSSMLARPGIYLDNLHVKAQYRGLGVGSDLFRRLAGIAYERGCARLEFVVANWNQSAIEFYEKHGCVLVRDWTKCRLTEEALKALLHGSDNEGEQPADMRRVARFGHCAK
jgi:GNAT superfamily N-acetyltransferase